MKTLIQSIKNPSSFKTALNFLKKGQVIILPTDTVYGICCLSTKKIAVDNLYKIKKRKLDKPSALLISSPEMLNSLGISINNSTKKLIQKFWPGGLTVILKTPRGVFPPPIFSPLEETIGIRCPKSPFVQKLIEKLGTPIVASSANTSGEKICQNKEELIQKFGGKIPLLIYQKESLPPIASTIITPHKNFKIEREGPVSKEDIQKVINSS